MNSNCGNAAPTKEKEKKLNKKHEEGNHNGKIMFKSRWAYRSRMLS